MTALPVGAFPFATTIAEAAAVLTPPPIVIWPGTRPVTNERFAGNGVTGNISSVVRERVNPPLSVFRKLGEKT